MIAKRWFSKFLIISSAGVPGGIKLLAMLIFPLFATKEEFAEFSRDFSFANALLMLSGVAYMIVLYKKMKKEKEKEHNREIFWSNLREYISFGMVQVAVVVFASYLLFGIGLLEVFFLSFFTGIFFVSRGYYIFLKLFLRLFFIDAISLLVFLLVTSIGWFADINRGGVVYLGVFLSSLVPLFVIIFDIGWDKTVFFHPVKMDRKEVSIIGWSNFTSVGIAFFIPMLIQGVANEDFVIYSSMASLVFSIITVIPRGILNENIGDISLWIQTKKLTKDKLFFLQKKIFFAVFLLSTFVSVLFIFWMNIKSKGVIETNLYIYIILLCLFLSVGQLSIVEATVMYLGGEEKKSLYANIMITVICMVMALGAKASTILSSPLIIILGLIVLYMIRWVYYCICVKKLVNEDEK